MNASFVPALGLPVVDLLGNIQGLKILDLGCGDGKLTVELVQRGAQVVGVDSSDKMVAAARKLGIEAEVMSGEALTFESEFDAVFTNAALHWMKNHRAVAQGVAKALKPGGLFVGEFGGHGNVAAICVALKATLQQYGRQFNDLSPWNYATPADLATELTQAGFEIISLELIPRPTPLPTGMRGWLQTFADPFSAGMSANEREVFLDKVVEQLDGILSDREGNWTADYMRLRFSAVLK